MSLCPCGSQKIYQECCQKYHQGILPENAELLMRSRYSAYALHHAPYIIATTHPKNSRYQNDLKKWTKEILEFSQNTLFEKLEVLEFEEGNEIAFVTFIAHLSQRGKVVSFKEKSRFEKVEGKWLYLSGEYQAL